jgi:alpha-L-fucosidase 2
MCNNGHKLEIILSLISNDSHISDDDLGMNCWKTVTLAAEKGIEKLKRKHTEQFSRQMLRTELTISSSNSSQSCAYNPVASRMHSFSTGCLNDSTNIVNEGTDVYLAGQEFQYGRYLLISSSKNTTSNLQGIWTDGPTSSWNGDYHLNINMQMIYWSADVAGMSETIEPLVNFIQSLSVNGRITAKEIYGSKSVEAWVAHGFTDNTLDAGLLGDLQWSLCVSCGAWISLHIFDHLSHKMDYHMLVNINIPILRGVILFFKDYMWRDNNGVYHTGPTTSPENSYEIISNNATTIDAQIVEPPPIPQGHPPPKGRPINPNPKRVGIVTNFNIYLILILILIIRMLRVYSLQYCS